MFYVWIDNHEAVLHTSVASNMRPSILRRIVRTTNHAHYSIGISSSTLAHLLTNCQSKMARVAGQTSQANHLPCLCVGSSRTPTAFSGRVYASTNFLKAKSMQAKREGLTWRSCSWRQATACPESLQVGRAAPSACTSCLCNTANFATLLAAHRAGKLPPTFLCGLRKLLGLH